MKIAMEVAKKSLRECYKEKGIFAGKINYAEYWARDSFYASWGALEIKDYTIVKKNLKNFIENTKDGQIPLKIGFSSLGQILLFFGIKWISKVRYNQGRGKAPAIDPNLLFIITLEKYVQKTNDLAFVKENIGKIKGILKWSENKEKEDLIYSGNYSTWQDSLKKKGFVLYTNVLYYEFLKSAEKIFEKLNIKNNFSKKAGKVKKQINKKFWDKNIGYYIDYFDGEKKSKVFSSDGNFFSIILGVSDKEKTESILKKAEIFGISKDVPSHPNFPKYGIGEVYLPLYFLGMEDYGNYEICWPWIGCLHALALSHAEKKEEAKKVIEKLSNLIIRNKKIYEVYEKNGQPVNRFFYKSDSPFSWTAGFFILANKSLLNIKKNL